tara:strand:- start:180 stop:611 length:432 start_codon:yes stop_codon:yes gene_type:complete
MKNLIILLLVSVLAGCSGCVGVNKNVKKHVNVTAKAFDETCNTAEEIHNIHPFRFPVPAQVIRHKNCMDVADLLIVVWPGEASEKNITAARLLMLMYLEHQNADEAAETTATLLKTDQFEPEEGLVVNMAFYELKKILKVEEQ